jgi:hypothetical protein
VLNDSEDLQTEVIKKLRMVPLWISSVFVKNVFALEMKRA